MNAPKRHWNTPRLTRLGERADGSVATPGFGMTGEAKTNLHNIEGREGTGTLDTPMMSPDYANVFHSGPS